MLNRGALLLLAIPVQTVNLALAGQFLGQFTPQPVVSAAMEQEIALPCREVVGGVEVTPGETVVVEQDGLHVEISTTREDDQDQHDTQWADKE